MSRYREHVRAAAVDAAPRSWYRIQQSADSGDGVARIDIFDEIDPFWGVSAQYFVSELNAIDAEDIQLHINSPGGDVYDAIAITNALRQHKATVTATIDGLAASAAGFIAVGGADVLQMAENSELMIHNAWAVSIGDADDMRDMAARLDRANANAASIYHAKAGGELDDWLAAMKAETWYSAAEAVDAGLADSVLKLPKKKAAAKAAWDLSIFNYAGRAAAPAPRTSSGKSAEVPPQRKEQPVAALDDGLRQLLGVGADADDGALLNKVKAALTERDEALEEATKPQAAAKLPDGVVAIDAAVLATLQAQAGAGAAAAVRQADDDRNRLLDDAIRAGKIPPAARAAYETVLRNDLESGRALLASLAAGAIPVVGSEIGHDEATEFHPTAADMAALGGTFAKITGQKWED
ncbi:head maturation protease, ClpP-related [Nocardia tengchongensis]|uniref:head maturation protease, ClpP-related n=1 Tax=Nocardia tengchongensis TaxID=2055889 RepID=UPI00368B8F7F